MLIGPDIYPASRKLGRAAVKMLGYHYVRNVISNTKIRLNKNLSTLSESIYQLVYIFTTVLTLFWLAVFFYGTFYYYYVPVVSQEKPVNFQFRYTFYGLIGENIVLLVEALEGT